MSGGRFCVKSPFRWDPHSLELVTSDFQIYIRFINDRAGCSVDRGQHRRFHYLFAVRK